jgi:hypothetical protein
MFDSIESKLEYALDRMEGAEKSTSKKLTTMDLSLAVSREGWSAFTT